MTASAPPMMADRRDFLARRVTRTAAMVAAAVILAGVALQATGAELGTAAAPFVMAYSPRATLYALPAVALLAAAVAFAPRLVASPRSTAGFAVSVFSVALGLGLALAAARRGPDGWSHVFDLGPGGSFEAKNEYLPGLPALEHGAWFFLDRFAEMVPSMPVNVGGHPPGLMLVIHMLGIDTPGRLAALCIASAAACAPLAYVLARTLGHPEPVARSAGLLTAMSPVVLLFGTTSADAVYAATGLVAAALLVAGRTWLRIAGFAAFALATLGTWALLAIGAWAALVAGQREDRRAGLEVAGGCAIAVLVANVALAAVFGYDAIGTLLATEGLYRNSVASIRPYAFWVLGSPVAWGVMLGPPIAAAALVAVTRRRPEAVALAVVLLIASVMGFTKAETERIWLPFAPLACVAAASVVRPSALRAPLALLAVQALAVELIFDTVW
jgi:hypothetical protein